LPSPRSPCGRSRRKRVAGDAAARGPVGPGRIASRRRRSRPDSPCSGSPESTRLCRRGLGPWQCDAAPWELRAHANPAMVARPPAPETPSRALAALLPRRAGFGWRAPPAVRPCRNGFRVSIARLATASRKFFGAALKIGASRPRVFPAGVILLVAWGCWLRTRRALVRSQTCPAESCRCLPLERCCQARAAAA
jgi:hypothetical protein